MKYVITPVRSWYSFRYGVEPPASLAEGIARHGYTGGILTDSSVVTGQLEFAAACRENGINGAVGAELRIRGLKIAFTAIEGGWSDLCSLITSTTVPERISTEESLAACLKLAAIVDEPSGVKLLEHEMGFKGPVFVSVFPEFMSGRKPGSVEREIREQGCRPIASWPVVFSDSDSIEAHMILRRGYLAIEKRKPDPCEFAGENNVLPDIEVFEESFSGTKYSLMENRRLSELISTEPSRADKAGNRNLAEERMLAEIVKRRLRFLYNESPCARARLEMELEVICGNGLAGYFLRFYEIIEYCRKKGISVSARGSAGGSIIAYLLGISIICPIRHGLSFSRFFNIRRLKPPDIDLDIDSKRRDEVIKWFLSKAGRYGAVVSQIVTHRSRSALRVAACGLGISSREIDSLTKLLRYHDNAAWSRPAASEALRNSKLIRNIPSHLAPHPCGLVCSGEPVDTLVPLQPSPGGYDITHFDKDGIEDIGLLKMDLLGQRGLTTISLVCSALGKDPISIFRKGGSIPSPARELLDSGRSIGVVHVESPAMRGLLKEMKIRTMEDVARALALVRPGASAGGGRKNYLDCLHSKSVINYSLPELRPILLENLGVMLYQEDVSKAAEVLLGMDETSSDLLRRMLKKKQVDKEQIISICRRRGMNPKKAETVWKVLSSYAGYGFCKAHAFTYGAVSCAAALLKAKRPALYMASVMAAGGGFYSPRVYLEEARRLGISFMPPGVNTGKWLTREREGRIIPGFHHLKGMGSTEYERMRDGRPYRYPSELIEAGCGMSLCRNMAAAGCFRETGFSPPAALLQLEAGDGGLFPDLLPGIPDLPDYSIETRVGMELGLLNLPLSASPLELIARPGGTIPLGRTGALVDIRVWGRFVTGRRLAAGAGFLMLEDNTGVADVFLPSPLFRRAESILVRSEATIIVRGKVERGSRIRGLSVEAGPLSIVPLEPEPPEK
ncbi:MAG: DNA polymerase III subunit alpha [Candidatus Aegiribacteria sp.]|nr:DNA polymerase III subunit alpha [Candidatus Aegiribacteria sp.]